MLMGIYNFRIQLLGLHLKLTNYKLHTFNSTNFFNKYQYIEFQISMIKQIKNKQNDNYLKTELDVGGRQTRPISILNKQFWK